MAERTFCANVGAHCKICLDHLVNEFGVPAFMGRPRRPLPRRRRAAPARTIFNVAALVLAGLTIAAIANRSLARKAEQNNPPIGQFIEINGVRLHYVERGSGEPLVLLHGNGSMIEDFDSSGLIDHASERYRVIVFDRPGFGHSNRPRSEIWTPEKQADLIIEALHRLGVREALVLGHSWGTMVAIALALKAPESVRGLILASGYYYPSARLDVLGLSIPAVPLVGDIITYTTAPLVGRLIWPDILRKIFGPAPVPQKFGRFPKEMALRPGPIRAAAAETAFMIPQAFHFADRYGELEMPVTIIAGAEDRLVDTEAQSARLHGDIVHSQFRRIPEHGHMVHQTATNEVLSAIRETAQEERKMGRSRAIV